MELNATDVACATGVMARGWGGGQYCGSTLLLPERETSQTGLSQTNTCIFPKEPIILPLLGEVLPFSNRPFSYAYFIHYHLFRREQEGQEKGWYM